MESFGQSLLAHWVSELAIFIGGLMIAFLRRRFDSTWVPSILYGLVDCCPVLQFSFLHFHRKYAVFSSPETKSKATLRKMSRSGLPLLEWPFSRFKNPNAYVAVYAQIVNHGNGGMAFLVEA